jgi:farnesyl diphosphate synthase
MEAAVREESAAIPAGPPPRLAAALARAATRVEAALDSLLPIGPPGQAQLDEAMRYAAMGGGKRLRAFLVIETAGLFDVAPQHADRAAAAVEMLHAYSLVHDDLPAMDDDDLRRGKPTLHKAFDEATAILAGDALQARAFGLLAEPETHPDPAVRADLVAALALAAGTGGMAGGQMLDLLAEQTPPDDAGVRHLQALKTGRLIGYCCEAGAILGQADAPTRARLREFGRGIGLAFQIADDLLDEIGDEAKVGKRLHKDSAHHKATLPARLGAAAAEAEARRLVAESVALLASHGARADLLCDVASYFVDRRS